MSAKARYHHGDLRRALIEAAVEHVPLKGVDGLSLRSLARDVGVTHAAPYRHFPNKQALLEAVAAEGLARLFSYLEGARGEGPAEIFVSMGVAYVQFAVENPGFFKIMYGPQRMLPDQDPRQSPASPEAFEGLIGLMTPICAEDEDPRYAALAAWSMVHGIATLMVDRQFGPELLGMAPGDIDTMVRAVLRAYRAR